MKKSIIGIAIVAIVFGTAGSCKSTEKATDEAKQVAKDKTTKVVADADTAADDARYIEGVVVHSKEAGDCEYTIKTATGLMYDPINLDEKYQKDGAAIVFKFAGLRMPNRCTKANPIRIEGTRTK
jgi:hypothetical protein